MPLSLEERVRLLSMVNVFEPLSREELEELAHLAHDTHLGQGEDLHTRQAGGGKLYALKEGRVQLYVALPNDGEVTLSVVEGGSIFGEMALTGDQLGEEVYARAMVRLLSKRLREAEVRLAELAHKQVPARLANLILRLSATEGIMTREGIRIPTPYTHRQLGTMIGAKREAVTRAMIGLREEGALEVVDRCIHLRDHEALEREAE